MTREKLQEINFLRCDIDNCERIIKHLENKGTIDHTGMSDELKECLLKAAKKHLKEQNRLFSKI